MLTTNTHFLGEKYRFKIDTNAQTLTKCLNANLEVIPGSPPSSPPSSKTFLRRPTKWYFFHTDTEKQDSNKTKRHVNVNCNMTLQGSSQSAGILFTGRGIPCSQLINFFLESEGVKNSRPPSLIDTILYY